MFSVLILFFSWLLSLSLFFSFFSFLCFSLFVIYAQCSHFYSTGLNILLFVAHVNISWLLWHTRILYGLPSIKFTWDHFSVNYDVITEHNSKSRIANWLYHFRSQTWNVTRLFSLLITTTYSHLPQNIFIIKIWHGYSVAWTLDRWHLHQR